jgi:hypothetical protein
VDEPLGAEQDDGEHSFARGEHGRRDSAPAGARRPAANPHATTCTSAAASASLAPVSPDAR